MRQRDRQKQRYHCSIHTHLHTIDRCWIDLYIAMKGAKQ
uniref:Uncharacterized protein n=1 Tax=Arundo donax TaxID=35708 RepID=A0A0A9BKI8_ARUDO